MSRPSRATLVAGVPIVALWSVAMGLLARRELLVPRLEPTAALAAGRAGTIDRWLGVDAGGERIGVVHWRRVDEARGGRPGVRTTIETRLAFNLLGEPGDLELSGEAWRPASGDGAALDFAMRSGGSELRIEGRLADDELIAEVTTGGETFPWRLPVDGALLLSGAGGAALELPLLEVGEEARVTALDPLTLAAGEARIRGLAREILTIGDERIPTRVLEIDLRGLRSKAWIDDRGEVVRAETSLGLSLERLSADQAVAPPTPAGDLLAAPAIVPSGRRPARGASSMELRLDGLGTLILPEDPAQQRLPGGRLRLFARPPIPSTARPEAGAPALAPFLAADAFVQSDHPEIRRQAAEIVGQESDPWGRALALHDWVFTQIDKRPVVNVPSALEVLSARRGDCNEHTVLYTALARAAGLPTRIAIGLVWSDRHGAFYYHAWPEVHVGQWVRTDPTLGQPVADATHLKLVEGGIETWTQILSLLGKLRIEVLAVPPAVD